MTEPRPTAWYSWAEFLAVYEGFSSQDAEENVRAVEIVSVWRTRGVKLPVAVESTASIVEAMLYDPEKPSRPDGAHSLSVHGLQSLYAMAIMRFCNGLVDTLQKGMHAKAVEALAEEVGVPGWVAELRHQIAHKDLPSLPILRLAAQESLKWLYERYWKEQIALLQSAEEESEALAVGEECDEALMAMYEACKDEPPSKYRKEGTNGGVGMARKVVVACRDEGRLVRFFLHHVFAKQQPTQSLLKATAAVAASASDDLAPTLSARLLDAAFSSLPVSDDSESDCAWDEATLTSQRAIAWIEAFVKKSAGNRVGRALKALRGSATVKAVGVECRTGQSTSRSVLAALGVADFAAREAAPLSLEDVELLAEPLQTPRKQTPWVALGSECDEEAGEVRKCVTDLGLADAEEEEVPEPEEVAPQKKSCCVAGKCTKVANKCPDDADASVAAEAAAVSQDSQEELEVEETSSDSEIDAEASSVQSKAVKDAAFWKQVVVF